MMKQVYVRGHYRQVGGRRSYQGIRSYRGNGCFTLPLLVIGAFFLLSFLVQAYPFLALIIGIAIAGVVFKVYHSKRESQQQAMQHQASMAQLQIQQEQIRMFQMRTLGNILVLTPSEFEQFIETLLKKSGYQQVGVVGRSGDLGVDIVAYDPQGVRVVIQCKRYAPGRSIGTPELQNFIGMMIVHHKAQQGLFVTTSKFSQPALQLASQHQRLLTLIDGDQLLQWVQLSS